MKRFLLIVGLIFSCFYVSGNEENSCKVIIYREGNMNGSALAFKITANDSLLIRIRNNTYFVYDCSPGEYTFMVKGHEHTKINLTTEAGQTYYLRFDLRMGFWTSLPELLLVDGISAQSVVDSGSLRLLKEYDEYLPRPRNRIGLALNAGGGFSNIPMLVLDDGNDSSIGFGGGFGIGINYGYEVSKLVDLSVEFFYRNRGLTPNVSNGSINYTSWVARITPSLIIPIDGGYNMRLKLGAGIGYYMSNELSFDTRKIAGGFQDNWYYENAFGPHGNLVFEMSLTENFTMAYGIHLYSVNLDYTRSYRNTYPLDPKLITGNGSGVDLSMRFFYNF